MEFLYSLFFFLQHRTGKPGVAAGPSAEKPERISGNALTFSREFETYLNKWFGSDLLYSLQLGRRSATDSQVRLKHSPEEMLREQVPIKTKPDIELLTMLLHQ